jgi:hypothetical protein
MVEFDPCEEACIAGDIGDGTNSGFGSIIFSPKTNRTWQVFMSYKDYAT